MKRKQSAIELSKQFPHFIAAEPKTIAVLEQAAELANSELDLLLVGESGAGKELLAQCIHQVSRRRKGPFVAINLAALPETLIEADLFGHEKGAFTGATEQRVGRFEHAHRGTLFLDEIGHLPRPQQAKLLRALQEKAFHRLGGGKLIRVDVRVVAATDKDLTAFVKESFMNGCSPRTMKTWECSCKRAQAATPETCAPGDFHRTYSTIMEI